MSELSPVYQRKSLLGKSIITLDDAVKVGLVSEVWIDTQAQKVVAVGFQVKGKATTQGLPFSRIQVLGEDAILIPSAAVLTDILPEQYSRLVDHEVITETGKRLGQIDDYYFDRTTGEVTNCLLSAGGIAGFLEGHSSLEGADILVIGKERTIVKAGAEERLTLVDKGLTQWVELGRTKALETAATLRERIAKPTETTPLPPVPEEPPTS